jgi:hypothetical protein
MQPEGLSRVTMRRLAQELDTGAASLYVYVRNTAAALGMELMSGEAAAADRADTVRGHRLPRGW